MNKNEKSIHDLWNNSKCTNTHLIGVPESYVAFLSVNMLVSHPFCCPFKNVSFMYYDILLIVFRMLLSVTGGASGKELGCQCRRLRDMDSIPGSGRSPGEGHGNPL